MSCTPRIRALLVLDLIRSPPQLGFAGLDAHSASVLAPYVETTAKSKDRRCLSSMQQKLQPQIPLRRGNLDSDCKRPAHAPRHASRRPADRHSFPPRTKDAARSLSLTTLYEVYEADEDQSATDGLSDMDHTLITKEHLAKIEDDWSRWRASREKNDHLRELQLDRRNIVLDSARPDVTPHIVITPPDSVDAWNNYWAICVNRTGPQDSACLELPQRHDGLDPLACSPAPVDGVRRVHRAAASAPQCGNMEAEARTLFSPEPRRVFSRSWFHSRVALAAQERELPFLDNISAALHRRQLRLAALDAASIAPSFRARWEVLEFAHRLERTFKWTDEAEPLLSYFNHCLDTTVIDSPTPCTVPHIVIQEPASSEPPFAASYHNPTPSQQDCYYLTVPASFVHFVNDESYIWGSSGRTGEEEEDCAPLLVGAVEMEAEADSTSASAGSWGEGPDTPCGSHYELGEAIIEEFEDYVEQDEDGLRPSPPLAESCCAAVEEPAGMVSVDVFECEEEDELPPFDDWYQSIASRAAPTA
ncbi:uncharacterized protein B0H18DRAFT_1118532 [Fomitopsis serialis]|uniref:uncharacterized protein n=1 Tax=Fomitopsis serialis TaxID=139415 RepID=UPI0020087BC6|nr:uncharacterized protein B0H18DRAFT_1118532 [Neoantrodia serialis]KAH9927256.1 hypothetical protein B0H18DRAFT_1118532 [Neoantrodia serialis]